MADLTVVVDGVKYPNPFVIGSGPPGTNERVICKAFEDGWGGVSAKTISLDGDSIKNVSPRYGKLKARESGEVIGFQNIELISDRSIDVWMKEYRNIKKAFPDRVLIASIMEEFKKERWVELTRRCEDAGADVFELNLSCPHGLPERKMGAAMGQDCGIVEEVTSWVAGATKKPVYSKMTPNITHIAEPAAAAMRGGAQGVTAINTILSVVGVDLDTMRPMPTVEGYSIPGGYSCQAVRPIALRMCMEIKRECPKATLNGMGGVECANDAIQFMLMGADTVQVCTAAMLQGYGMVKELIDGTKAWMDKKGFKTIDEFRGHALQFFTTHKDLVERQRAAKVAKAGTSNRDEQWDKENITKVTAELTATK